MRLYNFIKVYPRNEMDIYSTPVNILDNAESNSGISTMQSSSAQMNNLRDRIAAKM